jgi:hypothetical protein
MLLAGSSEKAGADLDESLGHGDRFLSFGNGHDGIRASAVIGDLFEAIGSPQKADERAIDPS